MQRIGALVAGVAGLLACTVPTVAAQPGVVVDPCATRTDVLGLSRVVEVDAAQGPHFGRSPAGGYDFLADREVVLTFDDGPLRPYTRAVLEALDAHCTKATFFMVGRMAVADPGMVQEVARRGHTVGAHTWAHVRLQELNLDQAKDEIELGFSAVARAMQGPIAPFFRYPYLRTSTASVDYLKSRHMASFGIDVDSRDFKTRSGPDVKANVLAQLSARGKGILLFHDIQPSTAGALKEILDALKEHGYRIVHIVPKANATTLADYDTLADREVARRKLASAKEPLAPRSVVWPQKGAQKPSGEVLPWAQRGGDAQPAKAKALSKNEGVPWYEKWLQP